MASKASSVCSLLDIDVENVESEELPLSSEKPISEQRLYEKQSLNLLQQVETEFRNYYKLYKVEIASQEQLLSKLRQLSEQFIGNANTLTCMLATKYKILPQVVVAESYSVSCEEIKASNERCMKALQTVREKYLKFLELTSQLDMELATPYILGDAFHQPIAYFMQLVQNLFKYVHNKNLQLDYLSRKFDPTDLDILQTYHMALQSIDFDEHVLKKLHYCNCNQPERVCTPDSKPAASADSRQLTVLYSNQPNRHNPLERAENLRQAYYDLKDFYLELNEPISD